MRRSRPLMLALMTSAASLAAPAYAAAQAADPEAKLVDEVVITASKTGENVREIAGSVDAITGDALQKLGAQSSEDYLTRVPGVVFNSQQPGLSTVTIRGVNTSTSYANLSQGTTGAYINDVPLTDPFFSAGTPDIDTFDVRNVEVHRGPQGTLFGSASLGGAVNYISNRPALGDVEFAAETTQGVTAHAGRLNSAFKFMVNVPLARDRLGIRVVGVSREEAGYIENLGVDASNTNAVEILGGRVLADWAPSDRTRVSWLSLYQEIKTADAPYSDPDLGPYAKRTFVREPSETSVLLHSLRLDQEWAPAKLTALATFHRKTAYAVGDLKRFGRFGFTAPFLDDAIRSRGHTFEVRLASPRGQPLEWLVGAMYDRTEEEIAEQAFATNAGTVADALLGPGAAADATVGDLWGLTTNDFTGREMALFGEGSYTFAERLKVTVGGRLFRTKTNSQTRGFGLLYAAFVNGQLVSAPPGVEQESEGFSPKISVSYEFAPRVRVYALASKGFRFGGGNVNPDPLLPRTFTSDKLWNYEVGLKSEWLDRTLVLDASVFRIEWSDIPLTVNTANGTSGVVNAGDAKIEGAEASLGWRVAPGLEVNSSVTYLDANLTKVAAGPGLVFGLRSGLQLPGSSDWMVSNIVRYEWRGDRAPFVLLSHRYASRAPALLQQYSPPGRNATVGGYHLVDVRAGITVGEVQLSVFANNLTDERAVLSATYFQPPLANEIHRFHARPRTFGITLHWER
jgi:iron complex outermembrane recepter protein